MSDRYPGGIITKTPVTPAGPYAEGAAPGIWTIEQQAYWTGQGLWPQASNPTPNDPYFQYVTSLLHGDGTNGGQNNTFLDSSTNAFTITRNGNTTQGSFSPYGSNWGNYFGGSSTYLTVPNNAAYTFPGDFTIEMWYSPSDSNQQVLFDYRGASTENGNDPAILKTTANKIQLYINGGSQITSAAIGVGTWNHIAICRSGSTITMYLNGISQGTYSYASQIETSGSNRPIIGAFGYTPGTYSTNGYISNLRLVKGTAVYTSNFTPSTAPLTAISGTSLLTCQSNRFIDTSTTAATITVTGTPQVTRFSPFPLTYGTQYSTSTIGGSGYFDGSGDYLTVPYNSNYCDFGTGDFTIECWVNELAHTNYTAFISSNSAASRPAGGWVFGYSDSQNLAFMVSNTFYLETPLQKLNQWAHIAVTRQSGTLRMYVNGVMTGSTTLTTNLTGDSSQPTAIGHRWTDTSEYFYNGYLSDLRIVKGTALYTGSTYTVPTAPLTAVTNTQLLCNMTNAAIYDNSMIPNYETVGNAQISTSVKKYGTGSIAVTSSGDALVPNSTISSDGYTGNFTYECWFYLNSIGGTQYILDDRLSGTTTANMNVYISTTGQLRVRGLNTNDYILGGYVTAGNWYHFALCKAGNSLKAFINGTQSGNTYTDTNSYYIYTNRPVWGAALNNTSALNGYLDDIRITRGYARYWENFTPPAAALPNFGGAPQIPTQDPQFNYTTMLLPGTGTNGAQNNTFLDSSANAFTITRNGNTTQGTFTPFSQTGWGNYFNGTNQYCTLSSNASMSFGTGDFTIEGWVFTKDYSISSGASRTIIGNSGNSYTMQLYIDTTSGRLVFGNTGSTYVQGSSSMANGQWTHFAITRSGTTARLFVNGTQEASGSNSQNYTSGTIYLGAFDTSNGFWNGYISNLRIVKGTALYTSNFTPSTTPLTAVSNTALLTFQSNRFLDNSSNAYTVTPVNSPSVQAFSPFAPTAPYSTSTVGGSGYFDDSGDYLTTTLTGQAIGTGNFTLEGWVYPTTFSGDNGVFQIGPSTSPSNDGVGVFLKNSTGEVSLVYDGTYTVGSIAIKLNTWNHVAVVRSSTTITMYVNGVSAASVSSSTDFTGTSMLIGAYYSSTYVMGGYLSSVRYVKGTAVYTTTFTPPTAPLTAISGTQLLTNFTNAGITDATAKNNLETVGNAQINSTTAKFGSTSIAFDGTGDYLYTPSKSITSLNGDFTIEMWVYRNSGNNYFFTVGDTSTSSGIEVYIGSSGTALNVYSNGSTQITTTPFSTSTWTHLALVRYGSTITLYINGASVGTVSLSSVFSGAVYVGAEYYGGSVTGSMNGYLQDFRITNGYARYVQPFTPPTQAFQLY